MKKIIGKEFYFVHKGTWETKYEWRIQKVKISGIKIDKDEIEYVEFSFNCCGYEYPIRYLKDTLDEAKKFAVEQILKEKEKQIEKINIYKQEDFDKNNSIPKKLPN
jgi:hypothetical protein